MKTALANSDVTCSPSSFVDDVQFPQTGRDLKTPPSLPLMSHRVATMATKRTLDSFFAPKTKKPRTAELADSVEGSPAQERDLPPSTHSTYPFPLPQLPAAISAALESAPAAKGKAINDQPDLDLLYFQPFIPRDGHKELFNFLRRSLFFYRVEYKIQRGPTQTQIRTPRYTTVFGVDETSRFFDSGDLVDSATEKPIPADRYRTCKPRPIPQCLDRLRKV